MNNSLTSRQLFRRSRIRLALWYALVMGGILGVFSIGLYHALVQSRWTAMEREIESIAGTLHDSLKPMLPTSGDPTIVLHRILPELCLVARPCNPHPTLIQRHTTGISDRSIYALQLFNRDGILLAFSPNQPLSPSLDARPWQTLQTPEGIRYRQFTIILHMAHAHPHADGISDHHLSWGYLQLGRTLATFDAETQRIQWTLLTSVSIALLLVVGSSWWLSGLAMQPIYHSYQQQQQFTTDAAHELRAPLTSLLATAEAALHVSPANKQELQTILQTIERQGRRLGDLIADLLLLTSLEDSGRTVPVSPCCLTDLVLDLVEEFAEPAAAASVELRPQLPGGDVYVMGNEPQLYRLITNLITNAIRYTPSGGQIEIGLEVRHQSACIYVKDTGIGIAKTEQRRIFDRFYRIDSDRSRKTGGTGLGLAIAQSIARQHHARLRVESEVDRGSIFTVEFAQTLPHSASTTTC